MSSSSSSPSSSPPLPWSSDLTLMIDNYDSFTYNIVQYLSELGAKVQTYRNDELTLQQIQSLNPSRIVISPGPGAPCDAGISKSIIEYYLGKIPILGICLGHQALIELLGGEIIRSSQIKHGKVSKIYHDNNGIFNGLSNGLLATRYHSLCGNKDKLPNSLIITAESIENNIHTIQGVRHKEFIAEGVQFHPESITTQYGKEMLMNFLKWKGGKWENKEIGIQKQLIVDKGNDKNE
jgi:anthranilate synthase/aminodeoxychorismate synthase-like glutamine amidotransferase